jgi:6-phosphogluconolactonase
VSKPTVVVCNDLPALSREAARLVRSSAAAAIEARQRWSLALAGGSTPRMLYELLAAPADPLDTIDWSRAQLFFGDERTVPPEHRDSNYGMARQSLLSRAPIAAANVHRMKGEAADLDAAAIEYEGQVRQFTESAEGVLDLAILGMGADGHTASLFPGTTALDERQRLCVPVTVEKLGTRRLTLTYPVFLRARAVLFLIAGADKADPLRAVLDGPERPRDLPSQVIIRRPAGSVSILCDRTAADGLGPR